MIEVTVKKEVEEKHELPAPSYWKLKTTSEIINEMMCLVDKDFAVVVSFYGARKPGVTPSYGSTSLQHNPDLKKLTNGEYVQCTKEEFDEVWKLQAHASANLLTQASAQITNP